MITGTSQLNLDAKGRMAIPTKHREELLQQCGGNVVVTISADDRCLWLYPATVWNEVRKNIVALPSINPHSRRLKQMLIGHAEECEMDSTGRILLTSTLREFAKLQKKVVLVGLGDKCEIWDAERWKAHQDSFLSGSLDPSEVPPELASLNF